MSRNGMLFSFIMAIATWVTSYFATGGAGGGYLWAPIVVAAVPSLLQWISVYFKDEPAQANARSIGAPQRSKLSRLILG
jgi:hypothetical protein